MADLLDPDKRTLYTSIVTPPPGYVLDEAVAATYSVDPTTLLGIPVHLVLLAHKVGRGEAEPELAILEGLRRAASRLTVFCEAGGIDARVQPRVLYGLLEPMLVEVRAPRGGAFHPKFWVLRFRDPGGGAPRMRLVVLSRNLTADRSWDIVLQLDGEITGRPVAAQKEIGELLAALPDFASRPIAPERKGRIARLADELRHTRFELPDGVDEWRAFVLGLNRRELPLGRIQNLAVISPFCSDKALETLTDAADAASVLVSRPDTLASLSPETRARFKRCAVLHEAAESEDGEENADAAPRARGLHAKVIAAHDGWNTRLFVGSANATDAALLQSEPRDHHNVELMVELTGRWSALGTVQKLVEGAGFGGLLVDFDPGSVVPPDPGAVAAEKALDDAQRKLADARLTVRCSAASESWTVDLVPDSAVAWSVEIAARAWPLTVPPEHARDLDPLRRGEPVDLGQFDAASVTGLLAIELSLPGAPARTFALNLPVDNAPAEREGAILKTLLRNRDSFLHYLLLLLSDPGEEEVASGFAMGAQQRGWSWSVAGTPLLEELTRTLARDPKRLREIGRLVCQLRTADPGLLPLGFDQLWESFEAALAAREGAPA